MYLYFDKQGILKEFINDESIRQNSAEVNTIYAYFESEVVTSNVSNFVAVDGVLQVGSSTQALTGFTLATGTIPYDSNRDLKYFRDGVTYRFYKYTLTAENLQAAGLALVTITAWTELSPTPTYAAQGMVTFQIQNSVVMQNTPLSQTDLTYLLGVIASKENANNKVTGFAGATDDTHFPTTQAVANYVEAHREIIFITQANTYAEITDILDDGNTPVLKVNNNEFYFSGIEDSKYCFANVADNVIYTYRIATNDTWTNDSFDLEDLDERYRYIVVDNASGYFASADRLKLRAYNTLVIYRRTSTQYYILIRTSTPNNNVINYTSINEYRSTWTDPSLGSVELTVYCTMEIDLQTGQYSITQNSRSEYSASSVNQKFQSVNNAYTAVNNKVDAVRQEYLKNASVNDEVLTIVNQSNNNIILDVSGKLNKNFSSENVLPDSIGENDYFIINVSGVPYKVSWQTIYNQLGVGGLTEHFKGTYNSLIALQTAYPTAEAGDYAYIAKQDSEDPTKVILTMAIWDDNDEEWQVQDTSLFVTISAFNDALNEKQDVIDNNNKLESDLVDDTGQTNKFVTQAMYDYLDNQLYQAPSIDLFQLYYNGQPATTPLESGSSGIVNQIRHREKNIDNISTLTFEGQSITPSATATIVNLTTPITIISTTTKTLNGVNTKNGTFSSSATISVLTYTYYKATSSTTTPTSDLTKGAQISTLPAQFDVSYASGDYIYFYHTSSGKTIQQYVLGQWTTITSTSLGSVTITKVNGTTQTYYAYRVGPFNASGTDTFRIA